MYEVIRSTQKIWADKTEVVRIHFTELFFGNNNQKKSVNHSFLKKIQNQHILLPKF